MSYRSWPVLFEPGEAYLDPRTAELADAALGRKREPVHPPGWREAPAAEDVLPPTLAELRRIRRRDELRAERRARARALRDRAAIAFVAIALIAASSVDAATL